MRARGGSLRLDERPVGVSEGNRPLGPFSKNAPEVPPPLVKMAAALTMMEAGLRLRNKFNGQDGG